jgi:hypothetical protein
VAGVVCVCCARGCCSECSRAWACLVCGCVCVRRLTACLCLRRLMAWQCGPVLLPKLDAEGVEFRRFREAKGHGRRVNDQVGRLVCIALIVISPMLPSTHPAFDFVTKPKINRCSTYHTGCNLVCPEPRVNNRPLSHTTTTTTCFAS